MVLLSLNVEKEHCLNKQEQFPAKFTTFSVLSKHFQSFDNNDYTFVLKYLPLV